MSQLQRLSLSPEQFRGLDLDLTPEQRHYLRRVLRLQAGDRFIALDGTGRSWLSELTAVGARAIAPVTVCSELPVAVTLLVGLPKGNAFDEIVRCGTELGVATFVPVRSDRALLTPSPNKLARWRRIAAEAAEQSERERIPTVSEPVLWAEALAALAVPASARLLCVARTETPSLRDALTDSGPDLAIAVGPEGGWTPEERDTAADAGFREVSLGRRILRAVTAAIAAAATVVAAVERR